jgi:membrane-bound inhibitor of C-type lysozyme
MPKTASSAEKASTTLTFFVGLTLFGFFFLSVGYYYLIREVKTLKSLPVSTPATSQQQMSVVSYDCDQSKNIQATYFDDRVEITLSDGRSYMLLQGMSASGARYVNSDESVTFWNKGNSASMDEKKLTTYQNCLEQAK